MCLFFNIQLWFTAFNNIFSFFWHFSTWVSDIQLHYKHYQSLQNHYHEMNIALAKKQMSQNNQMLMCLRNFMNYWMNYTTANLLWNLFFVTSFLSLYEKLQVPHYFVTLKFQNIKARFVSRNVPVTISLQFVKCLNLSCYQ